MAIAHHINTQPAAEHDLLIFNLRKLMQKAGLNEADLSRKTHIPQATLHKILSGKTEDPRASTLKTLSDFFGVSIDELLTGNFSDNNKAVITARSIPVISWKDCVQAKAFIKNLTPASWDSWMVSEFISENSYALSTKPSLSPRFPKNTILFIDADSKPQDGDYVVVLFPKTEEATLREFSMDGPTQLLLPINPNSEAVKMNNNIKILGVLIKSSVSY